MNSTLVLVFALAAFGLVSSSEYCSKEVCPRGVRHIACEHNGKFASSCPKNAHLLDMKPYIDLILKKHNEKRDLIAGGKLKGYESAARMATMQWNEELASFADLNVKQCAMKHDRCHNTKTFKSSGQNLAWSGYSGQVIKDVTLIDELIDSWFDEHWNCTSAIIASYPRTYSGPKIGHFTAMVIDQNDRVGCGGARYSDGGWEYILLACNYARTNFAEYPIYKSSPQPAVGCKTGRNPQYKNLCSTAEVYKYWP